MALDDRLQILSNVRGEFIPADQIDLYHIFEECQVVNTSEDFISDVFIVLNNTQKVVSSRGNMSDILFYDMYYSNDELSYLQFKNYMNKYHDGDSLSFHAQDGRQILLFAITSVKSNYGDQSSTICFEIDCDALKKRLLGMKWASLMDICVLTGNNMKICADETLSDKYEWNYDSQEEGTYEISDQSGENYIVSVLQSNLAEWKYLSIMPIRKMKEQARKLQKLAVAGLFLCTVTGILVSLYITKRNYHPIKMLLEVFKNHGQAEIKDGENEYQWLNEQMNQFFKQHIDTELLLKKNQENLKNYYLHQLLQNHCGGKSLEQYNFQIQGNYNIVLLFIPWKTDKAPAGYLEENALQKFALINVFEEMCLNYYNLEMVELGERVAAIISVPNDQREHTDIVKNLAEGLQTFMEESLHFSFTILCSNICQGWEGIHMAWQQAAELEEYVHLLDTSLLFYDDVKNIQPRYTYPLELEQKIINGIRTGNSKESWKAMEKVFMMNLDGMVSANVYRCLIYGLIGTLLEGANQGGYKEAAKELNFPGGDISKLSIQEAKQQFHDLLITICERICQIRKETSQDDSLSKKIRQYVQANYQDADLNISIASQHFDLTPAYLSSIYKKQTGNSLLDYINTVRIEHAEEFLKEGYSVVEVAEMSGFRDSGTFIRAFKKKKGITPGQLKKKM